MTSTLAEMAAGARRERWEPTPDQADMIRRAKANGWSYETIAEAVTGDGNPVRREQLRRWHKGLRR